MITKAQVYLFRNMKGDSDPLALDIFARWGSSKSKEILSFRQFERLVLYRKAIRLSKEAADLLSAEYTAILTQRLRKECEDEETISMLMQDKWTIVDRIEYQWKQLFKKE